MSESTNLDGILDAIRNLAERENCTVGQVLATLAEMAVPGTLVMAPVPPEDPDIEDPEPLF